MARTHPARHRPPVSDEFPILAAAAADEANPYRVLEHLQALGVRVTRSTLYRRVDELVERGLLARSEGGRGSRPIRLTAKGRRRLAQEGLRVLRAEPLGSALFALAVASADPADDARLTALLRERMAEAAQRLTREERPLRDAEGARFWDRAGRERRVTHLKADLQWLQSVMRGQAERRAS